MGSNLKFHAKAEAITTSEAGRSGCSWDQGKNPRAEFSNGVTLGPSQGRCEITQYTWIQLYLPGNYITYPTWGKGKSSSKWTFSGDMLVPRS